MARTRTGSSSTHKTHREDLVNIKVAPSTVAGEAGTRRLIQLFRVWCEQKRSTYPIQRAQPPIPTRRAETSRALPGNLVVRIAGYCAYFVDLSPTQQAEIIARTE